MNCLDPSIRFVGRWHITAQKAIATAPGAFFLLAFSGTDVTLHFSIEAMSGPHPHLWIRVDGGAFTEVPVDEHLRIHATFPGNHVVKVIFKSAISYLQRWYQPLDSRVEFLGCTGCAGQLPANPSGTIVFVGDSITEGVFVDVDVVPGEHLLPKLRYQNDAASTYAWYTAEALGYDPIIMGYGSMGVTRGGLGGVPKAAEAYPCCFDGAPISHLEPDFVVINHGANDASDSSAHYIQDYLQLLDTIAAYHPAAHIVLLQPFSGIFAKELEAIAAAFRARHTNSLTYIPTTGWVPPAPLHPRRDGHRIIGEKLTAQLQKLICQ